MPPRCVTDLLRDRTTGRRTRVGPPRPWLDGIGRFSAWRRRLFPPITILLAIPLFAVLLSPVSVRAQAPGYRGPDARQIRAEYRAEVLTHLNAVMGDWGTAWSRDDVDALANLYDENAVVFPPGEDAVRGREAIRAWLAETLPAQGTAEAFLQDFEASGSMAMAHASYRIELRSGGRPAGEVSGDLVTVLLGQGNRWKIRAQVFRQH